MCVCVCVCVCVCTHTHMERETEIDIDTDQAAAGPMASLCSSKWTFLIVGDRHQGRAPHPVSGAQATPLEGAQLYRLIRIAPQGNRICSFIGRRLGRNFSITIYI